MGAALHRPRVIAVAAILAMLAAACGADDPQEGAAQLLDANTAVVVANSPGTLTTNGEQRLLVGLIGDGPNQYIGGPDEPAVIVAEDTEGDDLIEIPATWVSNPGVALGVYVAPVTFTGPGLWQISVKGADETVTSALVEIGADSPVPEVGEAAPASSTLTGSTPDELAVISTDPDPESGFYDLTIAEAIDNGRASVIVFATPAFCQTAICGPTIDIAKQAAEGRDDVDFVHVEPYDVPLAKQNDLRPVEAMSEWGLATEPWIFVVDRDGLVSASFEGIISQDELESAIDGL
ncbi:MAG: hypothetical protein ACR2QO_25140 [Acidimicrobiales bacterium]